MSKTLCTYHDKVLLKKTQVENASLGNVILPPDADSNDSYEVVFVGPGMYDPATGKRIPMDSKIGDIVIGVPRAVLRLVPYKNEEYFTCREVELHTYEKEIPSHQEVSGVHL